jgi:hypothetical protein
VDYGMVVGDAWRVAWRHRYLWLLGLFAFTTGSCSGGGPSYSTGGDFGRGADSDYGFAGRILDSVYGSPGLLAGLVAGMMLAGLLFFVLGVLSTPALIAGTDLARAGRPGGLAQAWRTGLPAVWRLIGLWVLLLLVGGGVITLMVLAFVLPLALAFGAGDSVGAAPRTALVVALVLGALLMVLLLVPVVIVVQIWLNLTHRSLILDGAGVLGSIAAGWRLFRRNLGRCLVLWAIDAGLSLGVAIVLAIAFGALALPTLLGIGLGGTDSAPTIALLLLTGLLALVLLALSKALVSTYFAAYWTVAFRAMQTTEGGQESTHWSGDRPPGESPPRDEPPSEEGKREPDDQWV